MSSSAATLKMILLGEDRSAGRTLKGVGDDADRTSSKLDKLHKAGAVAGRALAVGLAAAGVAAIKMTQQASEDAAAQVVLATQLRNSAHATDAQIASTEDWITAQGKAYGVADDDLRPALARLAAATHDVGKAQSLASLAMDVSAGTGKSLKQVTEALAKAQLGSVAGLSKLGVATKDAAGNALTLDQITKKMASTYTGQAAKAAETNAGKQKILTVQMSELGEQIGYNLLPLMAKLTEVGLAMVGWVSDNTTTVGVFVGALAALAAITWAVSAATKAYNAIATIVRVTTILWRNAQFALNLAMTMNPIGLVVVAVIALVAALVLAYNKSETFRRIVQGAFRAVQAAAAAAFNWVKRNWPLLLAILLGPIGIAVVAIIKNWDRIRAGAAAVLGWIRSNWKLILAILTGPIGLAALAIGKNWDRIKDGAMTVVDFIRSIPGRLENLADRFAGAGRALIHAFVDGMRNAAGIVSGIAGNVWAAIKALLNSAIARLNSALSIHISLPGPDISFSPHIPYLARGVRNFRGGLAIVGEQGPELVGLPRGANVYSNAESFGGGGSGGNLGTLTVVVKSEDGRELQRKLLTLKRQTGGRALGIS